MHAFHERGDRNWDISGKLQKIRDNPQRVLFGEFRGRSSQGTVTVWVDILGRLKRIELRPGAAYDGAERELSGQIVEAYGRAVDAADFIDFDAAELAHQLNEAVTGAADQPAATTEQPRRPNRGPAPQDEDEDFENQTFLR